MTREFCRCENEWFGKSLDCGFNRSSSVVKTDSHFSWNEQHIPCRGKYRKRNFYSCRRLARQVRVKITVKIEISASLLSRNNLHLHRKSYFCFMHIQLEIDL
jgi:hypothetical protein